MSESLSKLDGLELDVAVIGSGFGGLYALKKMRDGLGLNAQGFDDAGNVGGTWYWNRYPGCRTDTEAHIYQYSFDTEFMTNWQWSERYPTQPEVLKYLNAVADKHDLRRSLNFHTRIVKAAWDEEAGKWVLTTRQGDTIRAKFVIEGVGLLSATKYPGFPGEDSFKGTVVHAARWPEAGLDLEGKRVGVVGTGSTGTQLMTGVKDKVGHLYVLQRTPQYVVPLGCGPFPAHESERIKADPVAFRNWHLNTGTVFGFRESTIPSLSVDAAERERVYEGAWQAGNGFAFMNKTFSDITIDPEANKTATDFIIGKIRSIVNDPDTARKLSPSDYYAKRPLATDGYYEMFNQDNVTLVDIKTDPIAKIVPEGLALESGEVIELDMIIYATGFDGVTGNYLKIDTTGRDGIKLSEKWADGPSAMIGMTIAGFPNLFMIYGPFGPFTSQPLVHEWQVNWIAKTIEAVRENDFKAIEPTFEAEEQWVDACDEVASATLFAVTNSWINGSNIAGKKVTNYFYMAGMTNYMQEVNAMTDEGYRGFKLA